MSPEAAEIHRRQAALCQRWAREDVDEASLLQGEAPAVAQRRIQEGKAWASRAQAHAIVAAALAGEGAAP